jgi:hypothetical protein
MTDKLLPRPLPTKDQASGPAVRHVQGKKTGLSTKPIDAILKARYMAAMKKG